MKIYKSMKHRSTTKQTTKQSKTKQQTNINSQYATTILLLVVDVNIYLKYDIFDNEIYTIIYVQYTSSSFQTFNIEYKTIQKKKRNLNLNEKYFCRYRSICIPI
jgi:hypothetical protein